MARSAPRMRSRRSSRSCCSGRVGKGLLAVPTILNTDAVGFLVGTLRFAHPTGPTILSLGREMDCFASFAMATSSIGHKSSFSRLNEPEACLNLVPPEREQGMPGACCTRGLVCNVCIRMRTRAYRYSRSTPAFPAQWFDGLCRALPGDEFVLPPSLPA